MSDSAVPENPKAPVIEYSKGRPAGSPRRCRFTPVWPAVLAGATTAIVAGGGLFSLVTVSTCSVRGATRSTRLQWEQRSAEINQIVTADAPEAAHD